MTMPRYFPALPLSALGFCSYWSYAFLESATLHIPLRLLGIVCFTLTLLPLFPPRSLQLRDYLDTYASTVAPFLFLAALGSFLACLGPLSLPPSPSPEREADLLRGLYISAAFLLLTSSVMLRWLLTHPWRWLLAQRRTGLVRKTR